MRLKALAPYAVFAGIFLASTTDFVLGSPVGETVYSKARQTLTGFTEKKGLTFYWGLEETRTDKRAAQIGEGIIAALAIYYANEKRKYLKEKKVIDDYEVWMREKEKEAEEKRDDLEKKIQKNLIERVQETKL